MTKYSCLQSAGRGFICLSLVQACIHQPISFDSEGKIPWVSGIPFILNLSPRGMAMAKKFPVPQRFPNPTHPWLWPHSEHPEKQFDTPQIQCPREQRLNRRAVSFEELAQAFQPFLFHAGDSCQVCSVPASTENRGCFVRTDYIPFTKF